MSRTEQLRDSEHCDDCGNAYTDVYSLPDEVWAKIHDRAPAGLLCPACALKRVVGLTVHTPDYEAAAKAWEIEFPCQCGPEYSERNLIAPNCDHHYAEEGARAIVEAALGGVSDV